MFTKQTILNSTQTYSTEQNGDEVTIIHSKEVLFVSIIMLIALLILTIYFIIIKRWQRFEMTILVCMALKYAVHALQQF